MMKVMLGVIGGVFAGALILELLRRKNPTLVDEIEEKARRVVDATLG